MSKFTFTKMHGLGNDFVVVDAVNQHFQLTTSLIRHIADRHLGVGCDQILVVKSAIDSASDFLVEIFNADGSEVGQCGNGMRCVASFIKQKQLLNKDTMRLATSERIVTAKVANPEKVSVNLGCPDFAKHNLNARDAHYLISVDLGNPHSVFQVEDIDNAPVSELGARLNQSQEYPDGVNVEFLQIINNSQIKLRVYERGVGETLACGSGACAAVAAGIEQGLLNKRVNVCLPGGDLEVEIDAEQQLWLTGPAVTVFQGDWIS